MKHVYARSKNPIQAAKRARKLITKLEARRELRTSASARPMNFCYQGFNIDGVGGCTYNMWVVTNAEGVNLGGYPTKGAAVRAISKFKKV